ncbi:MAG: hypothetical protein M1813_008312 [Trichoglossum hirsutum]|nr:MAG: hypothetical protein M1813_008312 [Trichoglossum hirsutum]
MPSEEKLSIRLYITEEKWLNTYAIPDGSLSVSIITKSEARKASRKFTKLSADENTILDSAIGTITLDCRINGINRLHTQLFYVVKEARAPIIVGNASPLYRGWANHIPSVKAFIVPPKKTEVEIRQQDLSDKLAAERREETTREEIAEEERGELAERNNAESSQTSSQPETDASGGTGSANTSLGG